MQKTNTRRLKAACTLFLLLATIVLALAFHGSRIHRWIAFTFKEWHAADELKNTSLWLPEYVAVVQAVPIEGVAKNLSGLTWNYDTGTLFAIVNNPQWLIELSRSGEVLRRIELAGFEDSEAVEYIGDGHFVIADERAQRLVNVVIDAGTTDIDARNCPRITLGMGNAGNTGVEGLAWDRAGGKLFAAKERDPVHIYEVTGFPHRADAPLNVEVGGDEKRDDRLFLSDVSSMDFNNRHRHLLLLSDESKLIVELGDDGRPLSSMSLSAGHGLAAPVPQAEGMAFDDENTLYLVSEPNLFYVFRKPPGR